MSKSEPHETIVAWEYVHDNATALANEARERWREAETPTDDLVRVEMELAGIVRDTIAALLAVIQKRTR